MNNTFYHRSEILFFIRDFQTALVEVPKQEKASSVFSYFFLLTEVHRSDKRNEYFLQNKNTDFDVNFRRFID